MDATIAAALSEYKPEIAAGHTAYVTRMFDKMVADLGPRLEGVYNDWRHAKPFRNVVAAFVDTDRATRAKVLDTARLAEASAAYAEETVATWAGKINAKLGELESARVCRLTGTGFAIHGTRGGRRVSIHQHMILNVSPRGTLFNQFPSRIYVDDKFTSEAAYKRAFSA